MVSLAMAALAALLALAWRPAGFLVRRRDLLELAAMTAGMQVALFAAQLIAVNQLQGVPDTGASLALAVASQTMVAALLTSGGIALGIALRIAWLRFTAPALRGAVAHIVSRSQQASTRQPVGAIRRRGPPLPLLYA
jgi:hypothetical protein